MNNEEWVKAERGTLENIHKYRGLNGLLCHAAATIVKLRTPPATGAAAMREAAAKVVEDDLARLNAHIDSTYEINARSEINESYALRRVLAAIRALPAPEVPEAAEAWLERGSTLDTHAALRAALAAVRKEEKGE